VTPITREEVAAELIARRDAAGTLYSFVKQAWPHIEGARPLRDGWALGAVCEHLQETVRGNIRDFILNIPPRMTKSTSSAVCLTPWGWINDPTLQFMYLSYSERLSIRDHRKARQLIESPWYQTRWGDQYQLAHDQNTKIRYDNDRGGYRVATSISGTITGEGADIIVCLPYEILICTDIGVFEIGAIVEGRISANVLSFNHATGRTEYQPIEAYEKNPGRHMVEIVLDDRIIQCTEDHLIHTEGRGYIRAGDLGEGEVITVLPSLRGTKT